MVGKGDDAGEDRLPGDHAGAVRAVLRNTLAFHPELDVLTEDDVGGREASEVMRDYGVDYVLLADHQPGIGRRKWTLSFVSQGEERWGVKSECAVEEDEPDGLAPLERAAAEVLSRAAERLSLPTADVEVPVVGAPAVSWLAMADAVGAERDGDLEEAALLSRVGTTRWAPMLGMLAAYCESVLNARETGEFRAPHLPDTADLPPDLAGLGPCLAALATGNRTAIEKEMGAYLAANPASVRGYVLLGLWRLHGEGDPEAALAALRHAVRLDPDYVPAARECVDLLRQLHPDEVDSFLARLEERASNKERVFRLKAQVAGGEGETEDG
jgi:hypothetical protein